MFIYGLKNLKINKEAQEKLEKLGIDLNLSINIEYSNSINDIENFLISLKEKIIDGEIFFKIFEPESNKINIYKANKYDCGLISSKNVKSWEIEDDEFFNRLMNDEEYSTIFDLSIKKSFLYHSKEDIDKKIIELEKEIADLRRKKEQIINKPKIKI